jgi:hypothetical protein
METAFGYGGFLQQRERGERDRLTSASSQRRREGSRKQISRARKCDARARARPTPTTDRRSERTRSQDVAVQRETVTGAWAGTLGSARRFSLARHHHSLMAARGAVRKWRCFPDSALSLLLNTNFFSD